jgi:hypothetical protein
LADLLSDEMDGEDRVIYEREGGEVVEFESGPTQGFTDAREVVLPMSGATVEKLVKEREQGKSFEDLEHSRAQKAAQAKCKHPINRRIGTRCGECGKGPVK